MLATCHRPRRRGRGVESEEVALERGRLDALITGLLFWHDKVGLADWNTYERGDLPGIRAGHSQPGHELPLTKQNDASLAPRQSDVDRMVGEVRSAEVLLR